jgi:NAD(P)-dependent dehydrogenase (short-subunit alcohol dehydrogenase family)
MIAIRGGSLIAKELRAMLPPGEEVVWVPRDADMPTGATRHLFCAGLLRSKSADMQTNREIIEGMTVNLWSVTDQIERIMSANDLARVCVLGSESGFSGSFDGTYAEAKKELHQYVESKKLKPLQQLVCIAPSIISDCGMTTRRLDLDNLEARRATHPKRRFLRAAEVARLVHFCLYVDKGYLSGTVIRLHGGR